MRLENWSVLQDSFGHRYLHGNVYGHKRFVDGTTITTSRIVNVFISSVETHSGSIYELGEVDPKYEAEFANAKERFFQKIKTK